MSQSGQAVGSGTISPDVEKLTGNTGGAVGPDASFNINVLGSGAVTVTGSPGTNTLTITVTGGGLTWTDITGATQTLAINNGYVTDRGGGVAYTLPATATEGDIIRISGKLGAWTIAQNANQQINVGSVSSTLGVGGSVASTDVGDCIELLCTTTGASTIWRAISYVGNLTVT